jgi:hypothetical protein
MPYGWVSHYSIDVENLLGDTIANFTMFFNALYAFRVAFDDA